MRLLLAGDIRAVHLWRYAQYFRGKGHQVTVASTESDRHLKPDYKIEAIQNPTFIKYISAVPSFKKIIRDFKPDLVNCHYLPNYGFLGMMSRFHPLVVSVWGSDVLISPAKSPLHRMRARMVLRYADLLMTDAVMLTEKTAELAGSNKKIMTVPYGVPVRILEFSENRKPEQKSRLRIISTRRLEKLYRVADFLKAIGAMSADMPIDSIVIGDGAELETLRNLKNDLQLGNINFMGALPHEALLDILRSGDLYVSCSESDSTSVSLLEAMASGLFPIVSDIAGNREWITDGINGCLFPVGDVKCLAEKIRLAAGDFELRKRAYDHNLKLIREKAVWEDNMAYVQKEFVKLASAI
jgi:glycosyltransferase involved in cell wall biosynthesis